MKKDILVFNVENLKDDFFGVAKNMGRGLDRAIPKSMELRTNITDMEDKYVLSVEVPGFKKEDITLEVIENFLVIKAVRSNETDTENEDVKYLRKERVYYGEVSRTFTLEGIDKDNIKAKCENGLLTVTLQKLKIEENKTTINIE